MGGTYLKAFKSSYKRKLSSYLGKLMEASQGDHKTTTFDDIYRNGEDLVLIINIGTDMVRKL